MRSLVTLKTKAGYFQLEIWSDPSPPPVAQLHTWTLRLLDGAGQPVEGAKVTVDAIMPAHGHGMPTQPQVKPLGRGLYQVEGMKFSMEGEWQVLVRIETQGVQDQAAFSLKVR
nr:FixH family protein [Thermus scotoductus]